MTFALLLVAGVGTVLCLTVLLLLSEIAAQALAPIRRATTAKTAIPSYVVLIPAHDEAQIIGETVRRAICQLAPGARLLVVADNCNDDTARIAREAGAEVVERHDPLLRAKGFALAHGIAHLGVRPPQAVIVMDADCTAGDGAFDVLARQTVESMRPVQSVFLMVPPDGAKLRLRMAAFAWAVRNHLRPAGLSRLSLPCQLTGSGMAFAWPLLARVDFATGSLVEDLHLGLQFARQGAAPMLQQGAVVTSQFAESREGQDSQRRRWEHGQLELIARHAPRLLWEALRARNFALLVLVCDLCVPPLALLAMAVTVYALLAAALLAWSPAALPVAAIALISVLAFTLAVVMGWYAAGRTWVSAGELLSAPLYVLRKVPLYLGFVTNPQRDWTRTKRGE
jgi:cellulose synthase/poly-beta-1,6-N-acetylglucosamine synthase-like glycosyltransferase